MLNILSQPYPAPEKTWQSVIKNAFWAGLVVALVLVFLKPFGIDNDGSGVSQLLIASFGLVTFVVSVLLNGSVMYFFPNWIDEKTWTVGKEIFLLLVLLCFITLGNWLYTGLINGGRIMPVSVLLFMFPYTVGVGIFPCTLSVIARYWKLLSYYQKSASTLHVTPHAPVAQSSVAQDTTLPDTDSKASSELIELTAENGKDFIRLVSDSLLFIESADNYSTIFALNNGKLQKHIIRGSLTRLESQLHIKSIVRVHRSYIANLDKVQRVSGNAQGYKLHFMDTDESVPVARAQSKVVLEYFR